MTSAWVVVRGVFPSQSSLSKLARSEPENRLPGRAAPLLRGCGAPGAAPPRPAPRWRRRCGSRRSPPNRCNRCNRCASTVHGILLWVPLSIWSRFDVTASSRTFPVSGMPMKAATGGPRKRTGGRPLDSSYRRRGNAWIYSSWSGWRERGRGLEALRWGFRSLERASGDWTLRGVVQGAGQSQHSPSTEKPRPGGRGWESRGVRVRVRARFLDGPGL